MKKQDSLDEPYSLNPSEYERMTQEAAEQRSEQYKKQMDSERLIFLRSCLEQADWIVADGRRIRTPRPKAEKEAILGEIRELEVALGLWSEPYNGGE